MESRSGHPMASVNKENYKLYHSTKYNSSDAMIVSSVSPSNDTITFQVFADPNNETYKEVKAKVAQKKKYFKDAAYKPKKNLHDPATDFVFNKLRSRFSQYQYKAFPHYIEFKEKDQILTAKFIGPYCILANDTFINYLLEMILINGKIDTSKAFIEWINNYRTIGFEAQKNEFPENIIDLPTEILEPFKTNPEIQQTTGLADNSQSAVLNPLFKIPRNEIGDNYVQTVFDEFFGEPLVNEKDDKIEESNLPTSHENANPNNNRKRKASQFKESPSTGYVTEFPIDNATTSVVQVDFAQNVELVFTNTHCAMIFLDRFRDRAKSLRNNPLTYDFSTASVFVAPKVTLKFSEKTTMLAIQNNMEDFKVFLKALMDVEDSSFKQLPIQILNKFGLNLTPRLDLNFLSSMLFGDNNSLSTQQIGPVPKRPANADPKKQM